MNRISDILSHKQAYSYEFFPPKDEVQAKEMHQVMEELRSTNPDFVSVTCGALGSSQEPTYGAVSIAQNTLQLPIMPHLTCVGQSRADIDQTLHGYNDLGVQNILALRGDGTDTGEFGHAADLVHFIRSAHPDISIGVAAHPETHPLSPDHQTDRLHLAAKLQMADFAITQFFFNTDHYFRLVDELDARGCRKPVIPGIILFNSAVGLRRIASLNNTEIPAMLNEQLDHTSRADMSQLAVEVAFEQIDTLRAQGVPGLHIYTLNKSAPALALHKAIAT